MWGIRLEEDCGVDNGPLCRREMWRRPPLQSFVSKDIKTHLELLDMQQGKAGQGGVG